MMLGSNKNKNKNFLMVNMYVRYNLLETSTTKTKEILINPGTLDNSA